MNSKSFTIAFRLIYNGALSSMHSFSEKILQHAIILIILLTLPAKIAIYVFAFLYVVGIFVNHKKEKKEASEKIKGKSREWWEVLGTNKETSIAECARVRKLLSKIYHPDGGKAPNEAAMRRINEAFEERASLPDTYTGHIH